MFRDTFEKALAGGHLGEEALLIGLDIVQQQGEPLPFLEAACLGGETHQRPKKRCPSINSSTIG